MGVRQVIFVVAVIGVSLLAWNLITHGWRYRQPSTVVIGIFLLGGASAAVSFDRWWALPLGWVLGTVVGRLIYKRYERTPFPASAVEKFLADNNVKTSEDFSALRDKIASGQVTLPPELLSLAQVFMNQGHS